MAFRKGASVKGLDKVIRNLQKQVLKIEGRTAKGLIIAVTDLREDMGQTNPLIPFDKGNLEASWFITTKGAKSEGISFAGNISSRGRYKDTSTKVIAKLESHHALAVSIAKSKLQNFKIGIGFGFGAYYASFVHEMKGVNWTRTGSGGRWFSKAIKRNAKTMLITIQKEAKIK